MKTNSIEAAYNLNVSSKTKTPRSKPVTRDVDIRKVLLEGLEAKYSDRDHDLIVEEFGCKAARADVAVINGVLHAYEIKSDSDSLDRLPSQIDAYQGVFEYVTLVCGRRLLERARTAIPDWWGLQRAEFKGGSISIRELRAPKPNPNQNPLAVAKMLWKTEALVVLRKYGRRDAQPMKSGMLLPRMCRLLNSRMKSAKPSKLEEALDLRSCQFQMMVRAPLNPLFG